jgi:quinol monooxygenase YgiN
MSDEGRTMVVVQGWFRFDPADRATFLDAVQEGMELTRAEHGCLEDVLAADPLDPGRVVLSERWESMADFQAHREGVERRRSSGVLKPRPEPLDSKVSVFEVVTQVE